MFEIKKYGKFLCLALVSSMLLPFAACVGAPTSSKKNEDTADDGGREEKSDPSEEKSTDGEKHETSVTESENNDSMSESEDTNEEYDVKNISAENPQNGSTVILANDDVYSWWRNYKWKNMSSEPYYRHEDIYYPVPVILKWKTAEAADYYRVSISENEDMSFGDNYIVNTCSLELNDLFVGTDYYWQVDAVYADRTLKSAVYVFSTAYSPRCINVEGVSNTRDIGGIELSNGYRIKQGMIYRGAKLEDVTENGKDLLVNELGIKTDLDLRTPGEGGAGTGSPLGNDINYINLDGRYYVGIKEGISTEEGKAIFADEIRIFADRSNYPVYIHCSLGRDRTGSLAFVLEALCGASINQLLIDYELSVFSTAGTVDNASVEVIRKNIMTIYDYISEFEGATLAEKTENYLLSIGITHEEIRNIKDILLEKGD